MTILFATLAGMLLPLAFAPFGMFTMAVLSPAVLLATWIKATPRQALLRGLFFGFGFFGVGASWIYISFNSFGGMPWALSGLVTFLFVLILSLYPAVQGYVLTRFFPVSNLSKCILAFPASWVLLEWLRGFLFSGFPWLLLGDSQIGAPLQGLGPILGSYGVAFAVTFTSGVLVQCFINRGKKLIYAIFAVLVIWSSAYALFQIDWTKPKGEKVKVSLVQGDVDQNEKWQTEQVDKILSLYPRLTEKLWDSKIIIWPEAAITITQLEAEPFLESLDKEAKSHNSTIITGIPLLIGDDFYNGIITLGNGEGTYRKHQLVPFGEYTPLPWLFRHLMAWVDIPMSSFTAGDEDQSNIKADSMIITPYICYEIAYADQVRRTLKDGEMIVVVTDDSWFGHSLAPAQHLQISQMRALETGRYLLTATNNGITAFITPKGAILQEAPTFQVAVLTDYVQGMVGKTPWLYIGNTPIMIVLFLLLLLAWRINRLKFS